jgi:exosortase N
VLKLQQERSLVYVKWLRGFYDSDHNPTLCWKGSGYAFANTKEAMIAGKKLYVAQLQKGGATLYTAWWYGNADHYTTSQWEWRKAALHADERFALVNVTAATEKELHATLKNIIENKTLAPLFKK